MDLVKQGNPLDWELARRRAERGRLEREVADRELALSEYRAELAAFERRYYLAFAATYAELDELEAQAAEKAAQWRPLDATKRRKAERLRARASGYGEAPAPKPLAMPAKPSEEIKTVYRALSKLIHPDLAPDLEARQHREALMAQANVAYTEGNLERLSSMLSGWDFTNAPVSEEASEVLDRLMRQIAQAAQRLEQVDTARALAEDGEFARLMRRVQLAEQEGRDLFAKFADEFDELKRQVRKRIKTLDRRLAKLAD